MADKSDLRTLSQTFRFSETSMGDLARVLAKAPLTGAGSIFGNRKTKSTSTQAEVRKMIGFQPVPVPLLQFDVEMRQNRTEERVEVLIEFSQPELTRPYLAGQFVWLLTNTDEGAVLQEEINTPRALSIVEQPLHGHRLSLRRLLFFAGGHQRLMKDVVANLRNLLSGT